ncbi:MAG: c-type cytochrome [Ignavibacteriaceae bacterium]|nr:c-type cytochrome [Ignavibacteriaceae bacterium]
MTLRLLFAGILSAFLIGCGGGEKKAPVDPNKLTEFQLANGIGPVMKPLELGPIDKAKAEAGAKIFEQKCFSCHRMDQKLVGPPLHEVLSRRSPEFVVNMIMNPEIMIEKHPEVQKMLAQYMQKMTYQDVKLEEAFQILEYLRLEKETPTPTK